MAARSIATATISFGLVTVPVRIYPAVRPSAGLSFHLLHAKDHIRLKQQYVCPKDDEVVTRSDMVKGYEYAKGYSLLAAAMAQDKEAALAQYAARGKSHLVLVRSNGERLFMQQLHHSDEVRDLEEVPVAPRRSSDAEVRLARQLIEQISAKEFRPEKYEDQVRRRIQKLIQAKLKGKDISAIEPERKGTAEVVDIMEALKASLARKPAAKTAAAGPRRTQRRAS